MSADSARLLRHAGFIIWTLAGLPLLVRLAHTPTFLSEPRYWLWLACFVVFGVAFAATGWRATAAGARGRQLVSLFVQMAAALAMIDTLDSLLRARLPAVRGMHPAIAAALGTLAAGTEVAAVVGRSGFSHRHFSALFRQATGLAPKSYGRVMRFQRALRTLALRNEPDLAILALEAGYFDQSHFNREFRQFTGVTPTTYRQLAPAFSHHLVLRDPADGNARGQIRPSLARATGLAWGPHEGERDGHS
jgi:AraC-like DNA-binding protein